MATRSKRPKYPTIPLQKVVLVRDKSVEVPEHVSCAWQASAIAKQLTDGSPDESLIVFCLNNDHKLICAQIVATGAPNNVAFIAAQVFRAAIVCNAAAIIVAHNHPSGRLELSQEDRHTCGLIKKAGETVAIPVLDFIVVVHDKPGCASIHD
jgi:DNA repair protein RadC